MRKTAIHLALTAMTLSAHPMGNFSVNHYSRLCFKASGMELTYVLDLAEIPTFQLMGDWKIDWRDQPALTTRSKQQAQEWLDNISVTQAGRRVPLRIRAASPTAVEGAGGMPVLRTSITAVAAIQPGEVTYEDRNFPGRAGWKEIVVDRDPSAVIQTSSQGSADLSKSLTYYPTDPSITPPQDLTARVNWSGAGLRPANSHPAIPAPLSQQQAFSQQQPEAPGTVVRGDFLSRMLQQKKLPAGVILLGILVAFGLGALHAMSPGHGKTIVAAYLVGSRVASRHAGLKHAGLLGFVVTFTHTFTVFLLGLGMLFFQQYFVPEKIVPLLGAISGLSIVSIGLMLLYQRALNLAGSGHDHSHSHSGAGLRPARSRISELRGAEPLGSGAGLRPASGRSSNSELREPEPPESGAGLRPASAHTRISELRGTEPPIHESGLVHTHGGTTHTHMIEGEITPGSLIALGISGGMVPCPSALILMLSAIALGHPGVGLILLAGFSTGLVLVLMAFGMLAIFAKHLLPKGDGTMRSPLFRMIPVFSAVVVIVLGLAMTAVSAGWIQPLRFLS
jgi:nickel/cobalt exporter